MVASAQGIDVSNWQGAYDWAKTSGLSFGAFRLTQGLGGPGTGSPDPDAAHNHAGIAAKGLVRMAYHFNEPSLSGPAQAEYMVREYTKLGLTASDALWLDHETNQPGMSPAQHAAQAVAFMKELDVLTPHNPRGVYTFLNFADTGHCAGLEDWALWLANPASRAPAPPPPWRKWTFWQFGQRGVDQDAFNGTAAELTGWIGSFHPAISRFMADGSISLETAASRRGIPVGEAARRTVLNGNTTHRFQLVDYLISPGPKGNMPRGLVYWA
jgi:GH25 family lysozyme M1 (1,4-beta-N-acetylmuramidase)